MHPAPDTKPVLASLHAQPHHLQQQTLQQMRNVEMQQPQQTNAKQEIDDGSANGVTTQQRIKLGLFIDFGDFQGFLIKTKFYHLILIIYSSFVDPFLAKIF